MMQRLVADLSRVWCRHTAHEASDRETSLVTHQILTFPLFVSIPAVELDYGVADEGHSERGGDNK